MILQQLVRHAPDVVQGLTHTYRYDALGRRIGKTIGMIGGGSNEERYVYAGDRIIEDRDSSNSLVASYVWGYYIDEVVSVRRDLNGDGAHEDLWYLEDDAFSVGRIMDDAGAVLASFDYTDFGAPLNRGSFQPVSGAPLGNRYYFTGREYDFETGFYWYRSRYYSPESGRFVSRDSLGAWGDPAAMGGGQTFVGNNPWSSIDPYGLSAWSVFSSFVGGVSSGVREQIGDLVDGVAGAAEFVKGLGEFASQQVSDFVADCKELGLGGAIDLRIDGVMSAIAEVTEALSELGLGDVMEAMLPHCARLQRLLDKRAEGQDVSDEEIAEELGKATVELAAVGLLLTGTVSTGGGGAAASGGKFAQVMAKIGKGAKRLAHVFRKPFDFLRNHINTARTALRLSRLKRLEYVGKAGSSSAIREIEGRGSAAAKLFDKLSKGGVDVTPQGHPGKVVRLPDGGFIGYRGVSKSGPPTIDINVPGVDVRKLKFLP